MTIRKRPLPLGRKLAETREHYEHLRKRMGAILYDPGQHNLSKMQQDVGFGLLDLLRNDLVELENQLTKLAATLIPPPRKDE